MNYVIFHPEPGSVNGRSFVDPNFPEDLEAAKYQVATRGGIAEIGSADKPLTKDEILECIFEIHNRDDRPLGKVIRSLSTGDVVMLKVEDGQEWYIVDSVGFKQLTIEQVVTIQRNRALLS